ELTQRIQDMEADLRSNEELEDPSEGSKQAELDEAHGQLEQLRQQLEQKTLQVDSMREMYEGQLTAMNDEQGDYYSKVKEKYAGEQVELKTQVQDLQKELETAMNAHQETKQKLADAQQEAMQSYEQLKASTLHVPLPI